jgi:SulP family sulfate permease
MYLYSLGRYPGSSNIKIVAMPTFDRNVLSFEVLTSSVGVAFIAILETLISARIADGMTKTEHDQRQEIFAIGLANILSGIMGGMPATAALARTALSIYINSMSAYYKISKLEPLQEYLESSMP